MLSCCKPSGAASDGKLEDLLAAANTVKPLAEDLIDRCNKTVEKGREIVNFATNIKNALSGVDNKLSPSSYVELQKLCEDEEMKSKIATASEMQDLAIESAEKASEMSTAMQEGADSSPVEVKDIIASSNSVDTDLDEEAEVQAFEKDVSELDECITNLERTNVLTAFSEGSEAFDIFESKLSSAQKLFDRIKELTISIATITQTFQIDGCCAKAKVAAAAIVEMTKGLRMSKLVSSLAELGRQLIASIIRFINVAWDKLNSSTAEFVAAKKMKNFVNGLDPSKAKANNADETDQQSASEHGSLVTNEIVEPGFMCCL